MWNQLKTLLLLGALTSVLVATGGYLAPGNLEVFLVLALLMNLGAYFFSDRVVLAIHRARPLGRGEAPDLHDMLAELSARAGIPPPRLYLVPDESPNAFATGRSPAHAAVAVTSGILRVLSPRELRGVLAHELAHVANRDTLVATIAAALATAVTYLAHQLQWMALLGGTRDREGRGGGAGAFLVALVAPLAATLIQLAISRSREFLADETGAWISGDPEALASALLRLEAGSRGIPMRHPEPATASLFIVSPLTGDAFASLFSTHPTTRERVERLRVMASRRSR